MNGIIVLYMASDESQEQGSRSCKSKQDRFDTWERKGIEIKV